MTRDSLVASKLHEDRKEGLITRRQDQHQLLVYSTSAPVAFEEDHSLTLFNVTPGDAGSYECAVNAHIGGRNLNIRVALVVDGESGPRFFHASLKKKRFRPAFSCVAHGNKKSTGKIYQCHVTRFWQP